jgi:hypothetical protein
VTSKKGGATVGVTVKTINKKRAAVKRSNSDKKGASQQDKKGVTAARKKGSDCKE